MKKNIFAVVLIVLPIFLQAQTILSDSIMLRMRKHLYMNNAAIDSTTISYGNLWVHSLLSGKLINNGDTIPAIDILTFKAMGTGRDRHILYIYKDKHHIINVKQSYVGVLKAMMSFFEQNPEMDDRLATIFNSVTHRAFLLNTLENHQCGQWYNWWHQQDSLSKQLNIHIEDWVN